MAQSDSNSTLVIKKINIDAVRSEEVWSILKQAPRFSICKGQVGNHRKSFNGEDENWNSNG